MKSSLAIVVPVFNPHAEWEKILATRFNELSRSLPAYQCTLHLVNDGSMHHVGKNEIDFLRKHIPAFHFTNNTVNKGKGHALRTAIANIQDEFVLYTDVDLPFTLESMITIIHNLQAYDLVFGIKQRTYYEQLPLQRKIVSRVLQRLIKTLFPALPVSDTQCGLKAMNHKGKSVFMRTKIERYLFDLEFILYAAQEKLNIQPVPVSLRDGIAFGNMKLKVLLEESRNLWKILRQR